jgi:hypothetical protein
MASLSVPELRKRNNFIVFTSRIRNGKEFKLENGNGTGVKLSKSILKQLTNISNFDKFKQGQSIILLTESGQSIKLTDLYKDSEFSGRTQATTAKEDAEIIRLNEKLKKIMDKSGTDFIPLKVGKTIYQAGICESTPGTPKCDFHFMGQNVYVGHISHKSGSGPRGFQQWAGTSQRVEPTIYAHPETQDFINTLREIFPNGIPQATTVGRKIKDDNLKKMAVYGKDYGGPLSKMGENNVDVTMQGTLTIQNKGTYYEISCSGHKLNNGDRITGDYEPIFLAVYKGDRSDHGIKGARITINPMGGRKVGKFI